MKLSVDTRMFKLAVDSIEKQRISDSSGGRLIGVTFRLSEDDVLCLETVDGSRIASATLMATRQDDDDFTDGVFDLPETLELDTESPTTLEFTQDQVIIENGGLVLVCRRIIGTPIDTSRLFPDESDIEQEYLFDPRYLAEALSTMKNTGDTSDSVHLKFQRSDIAPLLIEFEKDGVTQKHLIIPNRT